MSTSGTFATFAKNQTTDVSHQIAASRSSVAGFDFRPVEETRRHEVNDLGLETVPTVGDRRDTLPRMKLACVAVDQSVLARAVSAG